MGSNSKKISRRGRSRRGFFFGGVSLPKNFFSDLVSDRNSREVYKEIHISDKPSFTKKENERDNNKIPFDIRNIY
jgi:hypothetical protein